TKPAAEEKQAATAYLFSCSEGEASLEWPEKGHGVFTQYLLEGLGGKAADKEGRITASGLARYVEGQVSLSEYLLVQRKRQKPDFQQFGAAEILLGDR